MLLELYQTVFLSFIRNWHENPKLFSCYSYFYYISWLPDIIAKGSSIANLNIGVFKEVCNYSYSTGYQFNYLLQFIL